MKKIAVIGTGGTIAGVANSRTEVQDYDAGVLDIRNMVGSLSKELEEKGVSTSGLVHQFGNKGSSSYSLNEIANLSIEVDRQLAKADCDGAVVTCGTDTMEEIGYFLDLTIQSKKPVIIAGSMRPWCWSKNKAAPYNLENYVLGTDAPINLYNAILLAASGKTEKFGTVLMLNDTIFAVRDVTKTNAHRVDAFDSYLGKLGYIDQGEVSIYKIPKRFTLPDNSWYTAFNLSKLNEMPLFPEVAVVAAYLDGKGNIFEDLPLKGYKGIVTAGTGSGGLTENMTTTRDKLLSQGIFFVTSTRTGSGTLKAAQDYLLLADSLNPYHARILLALSILFGQGRLNEVRCLFNTYRECH